MSQPFSGLSVLLPVTTEQASLEETVRTLLAENRAHLRELLFIVGPCTSPASRTLCARLAAELGERARVIEQRRPYLGGALRDAFEEARGSHTLLMASDLETDPRAVKRLVAESRAHPGAIVTATRWAPGGGFHGYGPLKLALNFGFQTLFATLFGARVSDATYGFRVFPTALLREIAWEELRHAFLLETLAKPLRLGVPLVEVPVEWRARREGRSQNRWWQGLLYVRAGLRARFARAEALRR